MKEKYFALLFVFLSLHHLAAQQFEMSSDISVSGLAFSQEESPFWLYSNKRGRKDETTNFSGYVNGAIKYNLNSNSFLEIGVGALYNDGYNDGLKFDESYLMFQNTWLALISGRKQKDELYSGLSATNENILWSLNARPLPGIQLKTIKTIYLSGNKGLGFKAALEEYLLDDDRYVKDARVHHKSFHLVYKASEKFMITGGVQHFAQWAGTSPIYGKLPSTFSDYKNVFLGKESDDTVGGQEVNAIGNHLGSYEIYINTEFKGYEVEIIYNHLFEDGSSRIFRNTPDGRYGIFVKSPESGNWIDNVMYELFYTKNQSSSHPATDGLDNYFNNNLYRSGWVYDGHVLGVPFINMGENRFRIANNSIIVHHFGVNGVAFDKLPYKFLTSYRRNYGAKGSDYRKNNTLSTFLDLEIYKSVVDVNLHLGTDFNSTAAPNFGVGVQLKKSLF